MVSLTFIQLRFNQSHPNRRSRQIGHPVEVQLFLKVLPMDNHRLECDAEKRSNLARSFARRDQLEDLEFSISELVMTIHHGRVREQIFSQKHSSHFRPGQIEHSSPSELAGPDSDTGGRRGRYSGGLGKEPSLAVPLFNFSAASVADQSRA